VITPRRAGVLFVLLVSSALAALTARELSLGESGVQDCDALLARGDLAGAIDAARSAAEACAPGSPYPERGYARLEAIARAAEEREDDATAAAAWRSVRSAAMASTSATAHRQLADEALARLATHTRGAALPVDPAAAQASMVAALRRDDRPATATFVALGAGAATFFAGMVQLLLLPVGATRRRAGVGASMAVAGFVMALLAALHN
jgi:hypothetical protein